AVGGLRLPDVTVPLATYTGWSFRNKGIGGTEQFFPLIGSYVPFATTKTERQRNGDPRPSIQERYQSRDQYLKLVEEATAPLVKTGYLLADDVPTVVKRASSHCDLLMQAWTANSRGERWPRSPDGHETARRVVSDGALRDHPRRWPVLGAPVVAPTPCTSTALLVRYVAVRARRRLDGAVASSRDRRVGSVLSLEGRAG